MQACRVARVGLLVAVGAAAGYLLYRARGILPPFLVALALSYLLEPAVEWLVRRRLGRAWAVLATFAVVGAGFALFFGVLGPGLVDELSRLVAALPGLAGDLERLISAAQRGFARAPLPLGLRAAVEHAVATLESGLAVFLGSLAQGAVGLFSGFLTLLLAPVLSFYMLKDLPRFRYSLINAIPRAHRDEVLKLVSEVDRGLGSFVRGQLTVALIVAALVTFGLLVVAAPFSLLFGVIAGLAETVPILGPFIGATPAVVVALARSPLLALKVALVFAAVQQIEAAFIAPRVIGGRLGLHPLVVIFAILAGGRLFGFWGVFLAVPAIAAGRPIARYLARKL